jgi:hypothetical protein
VIIGSFKERFQEEVCCRAESRDSLGKLMNVYYIMPLEQNPSDSYWQSRFTMALLAIFAGLASLLATAGVY